MATNSAKALVCDGKTSFAALLERYTAVLHSSRACDGLTKDVW